VETLQLAGAACVRLSGLCMQAVGSDLSGLVALDSDESALEVCIHDDALYKSTVLTLP